MKQTAEYLIWMRLITSIATRNIILKKLLLWNKVIIFLSNEHMFLIMSPSFYDFPSNLNMMIVTLLTQLSFPF